MVSIIFEQEIFFKKTLACYLEAELPYQRNKDFYHENLRTHWKKKPKKILENEATFYSQELK